MQGMKVAPSQRPIRIIIIDRNKLAREALRILTLDRASFQLVGEAGNAADALALVKQEQPDVVLLDLDLAPDNGFDLLSAVLQVSPNSRVLVLTHVRDIEQHRQAMLRGAMGVLQKENGSDVLFRAIAKIDAGEIWYDRSKMGVLLRDLQNADAKDVNPIATKIESLTPREHEVIGLVSTGLKNKQIGERLFISETTVRHHLTSVFEKLGLSSRLELIIFAFGQGLATVPGKKPSQENGQDNVGSNVVELTRTI